MSPTSFIFLSFATSIILPIASIICFLLGVHYGTSHAGVIPPKSKEIEENDSGYTTYVPKTTETYKAYVPGKADGYEDLDS